VNKDPSAIATTVVNSAASVTNAVGRAITSVAQATIDVVQPPAVDEPIANVGDLVPVLTEPITRAIALSTALITSGLDVITAVEQAVTSIAGEVIPLIQQPSSDLPSLLGVITTKPAPTRLPGAGGYQHAVASVPSDPAQPRQLPNTVVSIAEASAANDTAEVPTPGRVAITEMGLASSLPGSAIVEAEGRRLSDLPAEIAHAVRNALRSVSLAELAAAALPGIAGLLFFFAAGVRVGHRQAKFGFVMQTTGVMRFARPGPLGVVRSGSLVSVHRRTPRAQRRLDKAA